MNCHYYQYVCQAAGQSRLHFSFQSCFFTLHARFLCGVPHAIHPWFFLSNELQRRDFILNILFRDYSLPLLLFLFEGSFFFILLSILFIALCKIDNESCANSCEMYTRKQEGSLYEDRNELPSHSREYFALVLTNFALSNVFYLYVILINEGGSSQVLKMRYLWNHSTVILHVGSPIHFTVRAQQTYLALMNNVATRHRTHFQNKKRNYDNVLYIKDRIVVIIISMSLNYRFSNSVRKRLQL